MKNPDANPLPDDVSKMPTAVKLPMLRRINDMEGCALWGSDGLVGQLSDYYFDDALWIIRYLTVKTGTWLSGRQVIVSPSTIHRADWSERIIYAALSQSQIKSGPDIDTEKPISRQQELHYASHCRSPRYWAEIGPWGIGAYPNSMQPVIRDGWSDEQFRVAFERSGHCRTQDAKRSNPHLRSGLKVKSYHVHATDGDVGHVHGILVDEFTWAIRYIIVNTSNWWLGREVLIPPERIENIDWADSTVRTRLTRQGIKNAPPYNASSPPNLDAW